MPKDGIMLVGREGAHTHLQYHALAAHFDVHLIYEEAPSKAKLIRWRIRNVGLAKVLGQLLFQVLAMAPMSVLSAGRRRSILAEAGLSVAPPPAERTSHTPSVNSTDLLAQVKERKPRLVVINGTRILTPRTLAALEVPVINTHAGITPRYRGVHGAYWALVQKDPEHCGVTVHLVDEGVDTGNILHQGRIAPTRRDNFTTYPTLQAAVGSRLLVQAVKEVLAGTAKPIEGSGASKRWYHPTLWEYLRYRLAVGVP